MRKIPLNVSSKDHELQPYQATPFTSFNTHFQHGWPLINPFCFIAIISNAITG